MTTRAEWSRNGSHSSLKEWAYRPPSGDSAGGPAAQGHHLLRRARPGSAHRPPRRIPAARRAGNPGRSRHTGRSGQPCPIHPDAVGGLHLRPERRSGPNQPDHIERLGRRTGTRPAARCRTHSGGSSNPPGGPRQRHPCHPQFLRHRGNLLAVIDPLGRTASTAVYDLLKRAWRAELLDAGVAQRVVDPLGGVRSSSGTARARLTLTDFDRAPPRPPALGRDGAGRSVTLRELVVYGEAAGLTGSRRCQSPRPRVRQPTTRPGASAAARTTFRAICSTSSGRCSRPSSCLGLAAGGRELVGHGPSGRLAAAWHDDARRPGAGRTRRHAAGRDHLRDEHRRSTR